MSFNTIFLHFSVFHIHQFIWCNISNTSFFFEMGNILFQCKANKLVASNCDHIRDAG